MLYKTINISSELHKALKLKSVETGLTIIELVEDACDVYLKPDSSENGSIAKTVPKENSDKFYGKSEVEASFCKHGAMLGLCKHGCK